MACSIDVIAGLRPYRDGEELKNEEGGRKEILHRGLLEDGTEPRARRE